MELVKRDLEDGAKTLILSYGITARTAKEAVRKIRMQGKKVSWMNILSLFPIPENKIKASLNDIQRVLIPEENLTGLYRSSIRHVFDTQELIGVNKIGGMITPEEIINEVIY